ncbi:hypothetical protein BX600DRAFT_431601 [Xylariales sp. PMI_506]|nr:hypothetical protein BX600DRAFT_431601 [Xylariales sp. PMI_506]
MAHESLASSLSFLTDAAHFLASASPEISAHLMTQRNSLMFNNNLELTDIQRQHVCSSCGHIMLMGQGSMLNLEAEKAIRKNRQRKDSKKPTAPMRQRSALRKHISCGNCGCYTNIRIPEAPRINRRPQVKARTTAIAVPQTLPQGATISTSAVEPIKASANASSKKRAKNRKQGLQALLQQSQASASSKMGLGLSLTDFMKK